MSVIYCRDSMAIIGPKMDTSGGSGSGTISNSMKTELQEAAMRDAIGNTFLEKVGILK